MRRMNLPCKYHGPKCSCLIRQSTDAAIISLRLPSFFSPNVYNMVKKESIVSIKVNLITT